MAVSTSIPHQIGGYQIIEELGRGGMGIVYRAEDFQLRREVALKTMLPDLARDPQSRKRFQREARSMASLQSDHIVRIFHIGEDCGCPFFVMELLKGISLEAYLRSSAKLTLQEILKIAIETTEGLICAHAQRVIHRDIKPDNLFLEQPFNKVKILDFGLARPITQTTVLTDPGGVLGTPTYMSLEQMEGKKIDHRSDIFSLGVILYRMCTGELPFWGATMGAVVVALATKTPPSAHILQNRIPLELSQLIDQMLARNPDTRPSSMETIWADLRNFLAGLVSQEAIEIPRRIGNPSSTCEESESSTGHESIPVQLESVYQGKPPKLLAPFDEATARKAQLEWAKYLGREVVEKVDLGGGIVIELVLIPPGTFLMGSPVREQLSVDDERPQRFVTIAYPFYCGRYPITQEQYFQIEKTNPSFFQPFQGGGDYIAGMDIRRFPVDSVSWVAAKDFCQKLPLPVWAIGPWRLPSEAEWEYACRAGTESAFHFGNSLNGDNANCNGRLPYGTQEQGIDLKRTEAVGKYISNSFGLFDMHGNIGEWVEDWFGLYDAAPNDGSPQSIEPPSSRRVIRGGSYNQHPHECRSAYRFYHLPEANRVTFGFRPVLVPTIN